MRPARSAASSSKLKPATGRRWGPVAENGSQAGLELGAKVLSEAVILQRSKDEPNAISIRQCGEL